MTDWTDEVRDRLLTPSTVSGTWGAPEDGPWCVKRADDIRAALGEIGRRGLQYPDDLGISRDAAGLSARCAELRDRLVAQGKRAEAAEAKLAEAQDEIRGLQAWRAAASINANAAKVHKAEVERLRGVISKAVGILEAKETYAFQPEAAIADAHAALRGGGE